MHAYTVQRLYKALLDDISQVRAALHHDNLMIWPCKVSDVRDHWPQTLKLLQMWKDLNICDLSNLIKTLDQVYLVFFFIVRSAATFSASSILVHRRVWGPAGIWAVWGGGTHPGKPRYLSHVQPQITSFTSTQRRFLSTESSDVFPFLCFSVGDWRWSLRRARRPPGF